MVLAQVMVKGMFGAKKKKLDNPLLHQMGFSILPVSPKPLENSFQPPNPEPSTLNPKISNPQHQTTGVGQQRVLYGGRQLPTSPVRNGAGGSRRKGQKGGLDGVHA